MPFWPNFFAKCISCMFHEAVIFFWQRFRSSYPLKKCFPPQLLGPARVFPKLWIIQELIHNFCFMLYDISNEMIINYNKSRIIHKSGNNPQFWKNVTPYKKRSPWPPKKWKWGPKKRVFLRINHSMYILQKTRSNLVYFGLWSLISDQPTPSL